jgi:hypothetical protein
VVARIEVFLRAQRPALAFTLSEGPLRRIEVEKTGARAVALRIKGLNSKTQRATWERLRAALTARGLVLSRCESG